MEALRQLRSSRLRALKDGGAFAPRDFRAEVAESGIYEMWMYDMIDDWFGITAGDVILALADAGGADIMVHLNSPGGMVTEGLAIFNTLRQYEGKVTMRVEGMAASAASFVMLAANEVQIEDNAMVMIHDAWDITIGPADEHRKSADVLDKVSDNLAGIYANKAGKTSAYWRGLMKDETWFVGSEAVDAGLADKVASTATADAQNKWDRSIFVKAPQRVAASAARPAAAFDLAALREGLKGVRA
jgi:ATP-dependent protease ClpP protease subunit